MEAYVIIIGLVGATIDAILDNTVLRVLLVALLLAAVLGLFLLAKDAAGGRNRRR